MKASKTELSANQQIVDLIRNLIPGPIEEMLPAHSNPGPKELSGVMVFRSDVLREFVAACEEDNQDIFTVSDEVLVKATQRLRRNRGKRLAKIARARAEAATFDAQDAIALAMSAEAWEARRAEIEEEKTAETQNGSLYDKLFLQGLGIAVDEVPGAKGGARL